MLVPGSAVPGAPGIWHNEPRAVTLPTMTTATPNNPSGQPHRTLPRALAADQFGAANGQGMWKIFRDLLARPGNVEEIA
jgi:hypothetical protein